MTPIIVSMAAVPFGVRAAGNTFNYEMSLPSLVFSLVARPLEAFEFENPGLNFPLTHIQAHSWDRVRIYFLHLQMPPVIFAVSCAKDLLHGVKK